MLRLSTNVVIALMISTSAATMYMMCRMVLVRFPTSITIATRFTTNSAHIRHRDTKHGISCSFAGGEQNMCGRNTDSEMISALQICAGYI